MIVPDFSPLGGSYSSGGYHHRSIMSIMEQGNTYRAFLGRSQMPYLRSPPPQPHPIPPPHLLIGHDPHIVQHDLTVNRDSDLSISTSSPGTSKMDASMSPSSSDVGPGWSPSSEKSHLSASSEDEGGTTGEGKGGSSERKSFKCPQCLYYTDRKNNLKRHIVTMHQECSKTLECCGVMFHSKAALRDHIALFHRGGYRCQICNRNFCRKALLRRHLTVHSGRKDFSCQMCGYATSHKSNLERHQKVHLRRPVCTTMSEVCGIPVVHEAEAENNNSDIVLDIKPKSYREKPSNRFVLLPNRIKCTHRATANSPSSSNQHWRKDSNSDSPKIKEFSENIFETVGRDCSNGSSHSLSDKETLTTINYDTENVHTELSGSEGNPDCPGLFSHEKHTRIFSKRRICVTPYKCSDCGNVFSKQGEFHEHKCRRLRGVSNTGLSVITAVRKGKIMLMSQQKDYDNSKYDSAE